jgi:hypothetical protein
VKRAAAIIAMLLSLLAAGEAPGQVEISYPLGEWYRVGKFLPVRVKVNFNSPNLKLSADGAVTTDVSLVAGRFDGVVPLLSVLPLDACRWSTSSDTSPNAVKHAFRPLADDERLIGATSVDEKLAATLFPNRRIVWSTLSLANPLPGPASSWEALDGIMLDATAAARLKGDQLKTLLAAGTIVAIRIEPRPDTRFPWKQHGPWWVVHAKPEGPQAAIHPDAYAPAAAWSPGWPDRVRKSFFLILVLFSIVCVYTAMAVGQRRKGWIGVVVVSIGASALLIWWSGVPQTTRAALATIHIRGADWERSDEWNYFRSISDQGSGRMLASNVDIVKPVFASARHAQTLEVALDFRSEGLSPLFRFRLSRGQQLAFVRRSVVPAGMDWGWATPASSSELDVLAQTSYLRGGDRISSHRYGTLRGRVRQDDELMADVMIDQPGYVTPNPAPATTPAAQPR